MATLKDKGLTKLRRTLKKLSGVKIKVGFLDEQTATIAAFNEFGAFNVRAKRFVGPRPFIRSTITIKADEIKKGQALVMKGVYEGRFTAKAAAEAMGDFIRRLILDRIDTATQWAIPLEAFTVEEKGHSRPLVDTGAMRDALRVEVTL